MGETSGSSNSGQSGAGGEGAAAQGAQTSQATASAPAGGEGAKAGEGSTAPAAQTGAEPNVATPPAHPHHERLSKAFPDRTFDTPESYDAGIVDHLTALEGYKEKGTQSNENLLALMDANPGLTEALSDMTKGASLRASLAKHMDISDFTPQEGDDDHEVWAKNDKERRDKATKNEEFRTAFDTNLEASNTEILAFAEENKLGQEQTEAIFANFEGILNEVMSGKITKGTLSIMHKAMNFDAAVAEAAQTGELKNKNQAINAEKAEDAKALGDGMPAPNSGGEVAETAPAHPLDKIVARQKDVFADDV